MWNPRSFTGSPGWTGARVWCCAAALSLAGCREGGPTVPALTIERAVAPLGGLAPGELPDFGAVGWVPASGPYVRGDAGEPVWLRVTVQNDSDRPVTGVLADAEYHTDELTFVTVEASGVRRVERAGERVPEAEKNAPGRAVGFVLRVPAHGSSVAYLRACDAVGVDLPLRWWPEAGGWRASEFRGALIEGAYFGALLLLLVYAAVLWRRLRDRAAGWYCGYLASLGIFMAGARGMWAQAGWGFGSPGTEALLAVALAPALVCAGRFASAYLELPELAPVAERWRRRGDLALAVAALAGLSALWSPSRAPLGVTVVAGAAYHAGLLAVAIAVWRRGLARAGWFVVSFGVLFCGSLPLVVAWLVSAPAADWFRVALLGSALEMLLLSRAISERYESECSAKLAAQAAALEEAESRRVIQEAYADELEHEVSGRTRELLAANADKDRLMAAIGHDLRAPLAGITRGAARAAESASPETWREFARDAAVSGREGLQLIEDLVVWAQLSAGKSARAAESVSALLAPVVALYRPVAVSAGVSLEVSGESDSCRVLTDAVLVRTLLRNLTDNAVKHARSRVVVSASPVAGGVEFLVSDDGAGLSEPMSAWLVAEPGVAAAPESGGLGLRLARDLAGALAVRLSVDSPVGGGTAVRFTLPVA